MSEGLKVYKCDGCGFETNDPKGFCPHCNVIVSTGDKYTPEPTIKICEHCKQPLPQEESNKPARPRSREEVEESSDNPIDQIAKPRDVFNKSKK